MKNIVFYGDSIIANFKKINELDNVINMGVGGDKTLELIGRLNSLTNQNPEKVFILVGINDFLVNKGVWGNHLKIPFYETYELLIKTIKLSLPNVKIYSLSILPINKTSFLTEEITVDYNFEINEINSNISKISNHQNLEYVDISNYFKNKQGLLNEKYTLDGIHLNDEGYNIFYNQIIQYIKE